MPGILLQVTIRSQVFRIPGSNASGTAGKIEMIDIIVIDSVGIDCNGEIGGSAYRNDCDICVGGSTGLTDDEGKDDCGVCFGGNADKDCNGDCFGTAVTDSCGDCVLGNTGRPFNGGCPIDCNGDAFGTASVDDCGICSGGNTGLVPNADKDTCGVCFGNNFSCSPCQPLELTDLVLVDATNGMDIASLVDGYVINKKALGHFTVRAEICSPDSIHSVLFYLNGHLEQTENDAPYSIAGDVNGVFQSWNPMAGNYNLTAIAFSGSNGTGLSGVPISVNIIVIDSLTVDCNGRYTGYSLSK